MADLEQNNSIIDLKPLSEPVVKLIETVGNCIGTLYEPRRMKKLALAENEVALIKYAGEQKLLSLKDRTESRVKAKEERRQKNIEAIIDETIKILPAEVSSEKVDEDWAISFFENCQDISDEQMRTLWAKILSGEISNPGAFSLRTLNFVKLISKSEAELFNKYCNYLSKVNGSYYHLHTEETNKYLNSIGLHATALNELKSIGLVKNSPFDYPGSGFDLSPEFKEKGTVWVSNYGEDVICLAPHNPEKIALMTISTLSQTGEELANLRDFKADTEYINQLILSHEKINVWVRIGKSEHLFGKKIDLDN